MTLVIGKQRITFKNSRYYSTRQLSVRSLQKIRPRVQIFGQAAKAGIELTGNGQGNQKPDLIGETRFQQALIAVANTIFPSVDQIPQGLYSKQEIESRDLEFFWGSQGAQFKEQFVQAEEDVKRLPLLIQTSLRLAAIMLSSAIGTFILIGFSSLRRQFPFVTPFTMLSAQRRQEALAKMFNSWNFLAVVVAKSLKSLVGRFLFGIDKKHGSSSLRLYKAQGYPGLDAWPKTMPSSQAQENEEALLSGLKDMKNIMNAGGPDQAIQELKLVDGIGSLVDNDDELQEWTKQCKTHIDAVVSCDAVVVGSGAGGGTAAGTLAEAGHRVIVLEKGGYRKMSSLPQSETAALTSSYESQAITTTTPPTLNVLAGSTVGGGTRINWSVSFRTPRIVRQEWSDLGLQQFTSTEYDDSMEAVSGRLQVNASTMHSGVAGALRSGLDRLGVHAANMPKNCTSPQCSPLCIGGCASGSKQDTVQAYLHHVCRAGGAILCRVRAERILWRKKTQTDAPSYDAKNRADKKVAVGVLVTCESDAGDTFTFVVKSKRVICSGGSLNSPSIIQRSGLSNRRVGGNLRLHPTTFVFGLIKKGSEYQGRYMEQKIENIHQISKTSGGPEGCPEYIDNKVDVGPCDEQLIKSKAVGPVDPWTGSLMTTYSNDQFELNGSGYGAMISIAPLGPALVAHLAPWRDAQHYKYILSEYSRLVSVTVMTRDQSSGRVIPFLGEYALKYDVQNVEKRKMLKGMKLACQALRAAGADFIETTQVKVKPWQSQNDQKLDDQSFEAFLDSIQAAGVEQTKQAIGSAHQMGTCRMGVDAKKSVVDCNGKMWGVEGLYVMDASIFPTCSGVNPMLTIMSTCHMLTKRLVSSMQSPHKLNTVNALEPKLAKQ